MTDELSLPSYAGYGNFPPLDMDLTDMNLWGIIAMPVGLILCFAPAMIVWWLTDGRRREPVRSQTRK